jgi:hypothetical protein
LGKPLVLSVRYGGKQYEARLRDDYLAIQYLEAIDMDMEICEAMDLPAEKVMDALGTFKGVPGRGEVGTRDGALYLLDRNPGISHMSVEFLLSRLKTLNALDNAVLLIDPVSRKVCDKMDKDLIAGVASKYGVDMVILENGEIRPEFTEGRKTVIHLVKEGYQ